MAFLFFLSIPRFFSLGESILKEMGRVEVVFTIESLPANSGIVSMNQDCNLKSQEKASDKSHPTHRVQLGIQRKLHLFK